MSIIQVKDLNLFYGDSHALKNLNIDIEKNTVTALIGPSGCGKSTFLRTLDRMNDLIEGVTIKGDIIYEGKNIYKDYDIMELRKKIGMVFQKPNPFPMSIYDNIAYGPRIHGIKNRKIIDEIVEKSLRGSALWEEVKDRLKQSAEIDILVIKLRQSTIDSNLNNIQTLEDLRSKQLITTNKLHDLEMTTSNAWENIGDGG